MTFLALAKFMLLAFAVDLAKSHSVLTFAGMGTEGTANGVGTLAQFKQPLGLCFDPNGTLYMSELNRIRKITQDRVVSTFAGSSLAGFSDGGSPSFNGPIGISCDANGNVFVADCFNKKIRKINSTGFSSSLAFGYGLTTAVFFDNVTGDVFFAENDNLKIMRIAPNGNVSLLAGMGFLLSTNEITRFNTRTKEEQEDFKTGSDQRRSLAMF